jgi:hypothetical protein
MHAWNTLRSLGTRWVIQPKTRLSWPFRASASAGFVGVVTQLFPVQYTCELAFRSRLKLDPYRVPHSIPPSVRLRNLPVLSNVRGVEAESMKGNLGPGLDARSQSFVADGRAFLYRDSIRSAEQIGRRLNRNDARLLAYEGEGEVETASSVSQRFVSQIANCGFIFHAVSWRGIVVGRPLCGARAVEAGAGIQKQIPEHRFRIK